MSAEAKAEVSPATPGKPQPVHPPNPYGFPPFFLTNGVKFNGQPVWRPPMIEDPLAHHRKVHEMPMREDDVLIAAYPKCGTHWVSDIVYMLTRGSADSYNQHKGFTMLEMQKDISPLEALESPRILNSHYYMVHLPKDIISKSVKIVHLVRNPKDTAVSFYHHILQLGSHDLTFEDFLKGYTTSQYISPSHQFEYLRNISAFEKAHPDHPIMHVYYEELKKNPVPVIQDLAKFLGAKGSKTFCSQVAEACSFNKLKKADDTRQKAQSQKIMIGEGKKLVIYRKGVVGDWKNSFTVAQNEMFDDFIRKETEQGLAFTFDGY